MEVPAVRALGKHAETIQHTCGPTRPRVCTFYALTDRDVPDERRLRLPRRVPSRSRGRYHRSGSVRDDDGTARQRARYRRLALLPRPALARRIGDEPSFRRLASDRLGVEVVAANFRELRTDEAFLDALQSAIAADLDRFNADSVDEVLHKYLGSSVHVREE